MNQKERKELQDILNSIASQLKELKGVPAQLKDVRQNQILLLAKSDAGEKQFQAIDRTLTNLGLVCETTNANVEQIRKHVMSTIDKQGGEITRLKLKLVKDNGGDDGGGRRLARKNS